MQLSQTWHHTSCFVSLVRCAPVLFFLVPDSVFNFVFASGPPQSNTPTCVTLRTHCRRELFSFFSSTVVACVSHHGDTYSHCLPCTVRTPYRPLLMSMMYLSLSLLSHERLPYPHRRRNHQRQGHSRCVSFFSILFSVSQRLHIFPSAAAASLHCDRPLAVNLGNNKASPQESPDDFIVGVRAFVPHTDDVSSFNTPAFGAFCTAA
jgi:hypothetical protein